MSDTRWAFISDTQFPKHDARAISLWFDVLRYMKPQAVDLVGDIDDADGTSRWVTGTRREGFSENDPGVVMTREFLQDIHKIVPRSDKHFHDGNHGWYRHKKWLEKNDPELLDAGTTADKIYEFSKSRFKWHDYDQPPVKRYGDLFVHHGEAISKHAGESVRNDCLKWGVSLLRGHSHRQGEYFETFPLDNRRVRGYEIGHMCDPAQMRDYIIVPNWQLGFAVGTVHNDEVFIDTIEISPQYVCVVNGKVFEG